MVRFLDQRGVRKVLSHCRQGYRYHTHKLEFPKTVGTLFVGPYKKGFYYSGYYIRVIRVS